jgi:hypothetical protein
MRANSETKENTLLMETKSNFLAQRKTRSGEQKKQRPLEPSQLTLKRNLWESFNSLTIEENSHVTDTANPIWNLIDNKDVPVDAASSVSV